MSKVNDPHPTASFIGNGAIGSLLAASCQQQRLPFDMWWRTHSSNRLAVQFLDGHRETLWASMPHPTELLIIATKAWQVKDVIRQYQQLLLPDACVVLLHNGAGTEEWTLDSLPSQSILRMTTSKAALKQSHNLVLETGTGPTQAGWLREPAMATKRRLENWCQILIPDCQWFADIKQPIWQKLAVNSVINPLTALYDIKNGHLREAQYLREVEGLITEFLSVCDAAKIAIDKAHIKQLVWWVIEKTANNYSSMHQDIAMQRPTEIDYINGFLLNKANAAGLDLPVNREIVARIKAMEPCE